MHRKLVEYVLAALAIALLGSALSGCFYYPDDGYYGYGYGYGHDRRPPRYHGEDD
ncbi:hypothetical protein [Acidihalobacter aeolianus]|uniref:hypothetical protein n=1 Tax=Acidihalobacter aeolianus TaxID=2792603 RepID=UPI0018D352D9|nr:hypothetical protein [Acidihalobacter aeolianus]